MNVLLSLAGVLVLAGAAYFGAISNLELFFGVIFPYAALLLFLVGAILKVLSWARSPVPFKITTTCGQQHSLSWIKASKLEAPPNKLWTLGRMALEVLFFRSLFRNTKVDLRSDGPKIGYGTTKWLWAAALVFHWSFLVILVRHFRLFADPVPGVINFHGEVDGFFQVGLPIIYMTDALILLGLTYLFLRRVVIPQIRYISLPADYFPLFLIGGIAISGVLMRYVWKVDIIGVKELTMGLVSGSMSVPAGIGPIFYVHIFLVSVLIAYFPFSKLMHMGGVFFSPTRNMPNDCRQVRHVNPWNPKVKLHSYLEYQEEFRDKIEAAGIPIEEEE